MKNIVAALVVCVLGLSGCGGDDDKSPLEGGWFVQLSATCGIVFSVAGSKYSMMTFCKAGAVGNAANVDQENGVIAVSGGKMTTTPTEATCPDATKTPETVDYTLSGKTLVIRVPEGALTLVKLEAQDPVAGFVATNGCFTDGAFSPSPLKRL